jgi:hypothetical protein
MVIANATDPENASNRLVTQVPSVFVVRTSTMTIVARELMTWDAVVDEVEAIDAMD